MLTNIDYSIHHNILDTITDWLVQQRMGCTNCNMADCSRSHFRFPPVLPVDNQGHDGDTRPPPTQLTILMAVLETWWNFTLGIWIPISRPVVSNEGTKLPTPMDLTTLFCFTLFQLQTKLIFGKRSLISELLQIVSCLRIVSLETFKDSA